MEAPPSESRHKKPIHTVSITTDTGKKLLCLPTHTLYPSLNVKPYWETKGLL